jgi:CPA1 family monovalent cation:H+ antiporter
MGDGHAVRSPDLRHRSDRCRRPLQGDEGPRPLSVLVDGESLFNDATAIALFTVLLSAINSDARGPMLVAQGTANFVWVSLGGLGVGIILAALYATLVRVAQDDPLVEISLSTVLAYTAFVVAQYYLDVSGIMAVLGAGLVGSRRRRNHFEKAAETLAYLRHYWNYTAFVANSFIFLLLGIGSNTFLNRWRGASVADMSYIACAVVAVILARLVVVYGFLGLLNRCTNIEPIDRRYQAIIFWGGGMRGALPLVLALSLPAAFEQRELILHLTAGVVLFTLLVPGTTAGRQIRSLTVHT